MKATTQDQALNRIAELLGGKEITPENVLEIGCSSMREIIYREYPASDPKVVEALLLMYTNVCSEISAEIDKEDGEDISEQFIKEITRFGNALDKTIKTLAGL